MKKPLLLCLVLGFAAPAAALADSVEVEATLDTSFLSGFATNNMGAHVHAATGRTNNGMIRRALFFMDIAAAIPAGATIDAACFEFDVTEQGGPQGQQGATFELRRLTTFWEEGTGTSAIGSSTGDGATWLSATGIVDWTTVGGDFVAVTSGSVFIDQPTGGFPELVTNTLGNEQLVADVQDMLDNPSANLGFVLKGATETEAGSAIRVTSQENTDAKLGAAARLIVEYTTPGDSCADTNGDGVVDLTDLINVLANWGPCPGCPEDIDGNGDVGITDLIDVLADWGTCP